MKYHAAWLEQLPVWEQVAEQLHPGAWVAYQGPDTLGARTAGFEVRDSLFCVAPGGPVIVWLFRKPLEEKTVARQAMTTGTGGINIDGCRISTQENLGGGAYAKDATERWDGTENWRYKRGVVTEFVQPEGRWPANFCLVHGPGCRESSQSWSCQPGCPSLTLGVQAGIRPGMSGGGKHREGYPGGLFGSIDCPHTARGDTGTASRFFYQAKSLQDLRGYLVKLILPSGGKLLEYANPSP